jgi:uridine kinase
MLKPLIIGIAGGSGSGKSTVARNVADHLTTSSVAFIDMDAYYKNFTSLSLDDRRKLNWDHPDAFDYDLLCSHLNALSTRQAIEKPEYDFVTHLRGRPLDEIIEQYLSTVQPMHQQFVEPSKRYADVIVPRGGHNAIAIEMIVAKIQRRLQRAVLGREARHTPSEPQPASRGRT